MGIKEEFDQAKGSAKVEDGGGDLPVYVWEAAGRVDH